MLSKTKLTRPENSTSVSQKPSALFTNEGIKPEPDKPEPLDHLCAHTTSFFL